MCAVMRHQAKKYAGNIVHSHHVSKGNFGLEQHQPEPEPIRAGANSARERE